MSLFAADDNAVSGMLGYILLAGIVMTAIAIVLMIGYPIYQNSITEAHMTNMEEGFDLLSANGNKVAMCESPVQSSELKIYGGVLSIENDTSIDILAHKNPALNPGNPNPVDLLFSHPKAMEYTMGDKKVAYVLGGVFKEEGGTTTMIKEPPMYSDYDPDKGTYTMLVLPIVVLQNDAQALGGTGLSRVMMNTPFYSKSSQIITTPHATPIYNVDHVTITIKGELSQGFEGYFSNAAKFGDSITHSYNPALNELVIDYDFHNYPDGITLYVIESDLSIEVN